jgi:hypothetical protein
MNEDIYLYNNDGSIKYDQKHYDFCIKNNLWPGFARIRKAEVDRESSIEQVKQFLTSLITNNSNFTKGALMKYARKHYEGQCAYKDVGKVVSRIVKEELGKYGRWEKATNNNYIRLRRKHGDPHI